MAGRKGWLSLVVGGGIMIRRSTRPTRQFLDLGGTTEVDKDSEDVTFSTMGGGEGRR